MDLNELKNKAYEIACQHGWHDEDLSDEHWLMLVVTELSEAIEADRKNRHAMVAEFKCADMYALREKHLSGEEYDSEFKKSFKDYIKDTVEDELADVVIRCLDLAGLRNIDLSVKGKPKKNNFELLKASAECDAENDSFTEWCLSVVTVITMDFRLDFKISIIFLLVFTYCKSRKIDLKWHTEQKMKYNSLRPVKHGGKKY